MFRLFATIRITQNRYLDRISKSDFQGSVVLWSALQLQGGLEIREGGAAPQLSTYMIHRHPDLKDVKTFPEGCLADLWRETKKISIPLPLLII